MDSDWNESDEAPLRETSTQTLKCPIQGCSESFRKKDSYDRHVFRHTGIKTHKCQVADCEKAYSCSSHLKRHHQTSHEIEEGDKEFIKCSHPDCIRVYQSLSNMKKHYKQAHVNAKTHDCPECKQKFTKKRQLRIHSYTHSGNYPQKCLECGAGFQNLKELLHHKAAEHSKTGPKKCAGCDEQFANWTLLVAHRKERHASTFTCAHCDRVFYSKCKWKIHSVTHLDPDVWLTCEHEGCDHKCQTKHQMVVHIRRKHWDERFRCVPCNKLFATKQVLQRHERVIHDPNRPASAGQRPRRPIGPRNRRKDTGLPKVSAASKLSGVVADPEIEKILLAGEGRRLRIEYSPVACALESTSNTDTESEARQQQQQTSNNSYAF